MSGQASTKSLVPLPGGGLAVFSASGENFYHPDHLGSSRLISTSNRTMYYDGAYAPFGEPYAQSGTADLSFTGQRQDTVAGLYDFPAREYSYQGRWPSPDPAGLAAVDPSNPQSWNRYAYVLNNPMALTDPTGLTDCPRNQTCGDLWDFGFWDGRVPIGLGGGGGKFDLLNLAFTPTAGGDLLPDPAYWGSTGSPDDVFGISPFIVDPLVYGNWDLLRLIGESTGTSRVDDKEKPVLAKKKVDPTACKAEFLTSKYGAGTPAFVNHLSLLSLFGPSRGSSVLTSLIMGGVKTEIVSIITAEAGAAAGTAAGMTFLVPTSVGTLYDLEARKACTP
jgi:RHS repeat-associated protein